jgi:hypothetical protein
LLVALDSQTQRLLKYQELEGPAAGGAGDAAAAGVARPHHHHHHHHHHQGKRARGSQFWKLDAALWSERDSIQVSPLTP